MSKPLPDTVQAGQTEFARHMDRGDAAAAAEFAERLVAKFPTRREAIQMYGAALIAMHHTRDELASNGLDKNARRRLELCVGYEAVGDYAAAIKNAEALPTDRAFVSEFLELACRKAPASARVSFQAIKSPIAYLGRGQWRTPTGTFERFLKEQDLGQAKAHAEGLVRQYPDWMPGWEMCGLTSILAHHRHEDLVGTGLTDHQLRALCRAVAFDAKQRPADAKHALRSLPEKNRIVRALSHKLRGSNTRAAYVGDGQWRTGLFEPVPDKSIEIPDSVKVILFCAAVVAASYFGSPVLGVAAFFGLLAIVCFREVKTAAEFVAVLSFAGIAALAGIGYVLGAHEQARPLKTLTLLDKDLDGGVTVVARLDVARERTDSARQLYQIDANLVVSGNSSVKFPKYAENPLPGILKFSPSGGVFPRPLAVEIRWPIGAIERDVVDNLAFLDFDAHHGVWNLVPIDRVDAERRSVVARVSHFSYKALALLVFRVTDLSVKALDGRAASQRVGLNRGRADRLAVTFNYKRKLAGPKYVNVELCRADESSCRLCERVRVRHGARTAGAICSLPEQRDLVRIYKIRVCGSGKEPICYWKRSIPVESGRLEQWYRELAPLAARYAPVLRMSSGEQYAPTSVEQLLSGVKLQLVSPWLLETESNGSRSSRTVTLTEDTLASVLIDPRTDASLIDSNHDTRSELETRTTTRVSSVVYWQAAGTPDRPVITYWMLYPYDPKAPSWHGAGAHQFDVESFSIVFDRARKPIEAVYAGHLDNQLMQRHAQTSVERISVRKGGIRVPWNYALRDCDRPLVFVARGSHAAYPRAGLWDLRIPKEFGDKRLVLELDEPAMGDGSALCPIVDQSDGAREACARQRSRGYRLEQLPRPAQMSNPTKDRRWERALLYSGAWVDGLGSENSHFPPFHRRYRAASWIATLDPPGRLQCPGGSCATCERNKTTAARPAKNDTGRFVPTTIPRPQLAPLIDCRAFAEKQRREGARPVRWFKALLRDVGVDPLELGEEACRRKLFNHGSKKLIQWETRTPGVGTSIHSRECRQQNDLACYLSRDIIGNQRRYGLYVASHLVRVTTGLDLGRLSAKYRIQVAKAWAFNLYAISKGTSCLLRARSPSEIRACYKHHSRAKGKDAQRRRALAAPRGMAGLDDWYFTLGEVADYEKLIADTIDQAVRDCTARNSLQPQTCAQLRRKARDYAH